KPMPPNSSGSATPRSPASPRARHSSRSSRSLAFSKSGSRSVLQKSPKSFSASLRMSSCSLVNPKSIVVSSAQRARHLEAGHRDDVALDLVGSAAERQDKHRAVHALDASADQGLG